MENMVTKEINTKQIIKNVKWSEILLCMFAFMFARVGVMGEFYTLGIAYLSSLYIRKELRRWASVFTLLGFVSVAVFDSQIIKYIIIASIIILCREIGNYYLNIFNQIIIMSISMFVVSFAELLILGFNFINFSLILIEILVADALMVIFSYGVEVIRENRKRCLTQKEAISIILIFTGIIAGIVDICIELPIFNEIFFRDIFAFTFLIAVTYLGGVNIGVTVSVIVSAVLTAIDYMPVNFCVIYGLSSLLGGVFTSIGRLGVVLGVGLGQIIGFIIFNNGQIDMSLVGAYLIAGIISLLLPANYLGIANWFKDHYIEESEQLHMERIQRIVTNRLNQFVYAFTKLSQTYQKQDYNKLEITNKQVENIIYEMIEKNCKNCSMYKFCWEIDVDETYHSMYNIIMTGDTNGKILIGDIPEKFKQNCKYHETIAYSLNYALDLNKQKIIYHNKGIESKILMGQQLEAITQSICNLTTEIEEEVKFNREEEAKLIEQIKYQGIKVDEVIVMESREKLKSIEVYTRPCEKEIGFEKRLIKAVERTRGTKFIIEKHQCNTDGCYFKLVAKQKFGVVAGTASCAKGKFSGDVHSFMELENSQYLLALADGMGSGELAQKESVATIEMLEEFMTSELDYQVALKLINSNLVLKSENEIFSTIDVVLIDSTTGLATFLKAGAATSFVLRGNEIFTISSTSLPVGILRDLDLEQHEVQLQNGDIVIMVTDGLLVTQDDVLGREETFKQFIMETKSRDPQHIADYLLERSRSLLAGDYTDDMTVVVGRIWEKYM
ncbi:MAG: hypothetical protein ATN32_07585 [Candidatus Epulonipiscium fishelsonii]|nr:MAG: hypothetical protein ATN32_07585 [Epulopiscium sp. AS2M-Bin002]